MKAAHHTGGRNAPATFGTRAGSATFDAQAGVVTQNKDKTTMAKEMLTRNPAELRPHPLFAKTHHPMMAKDSAAWAALVESVRENGVIETVKITSDNLIVDGRHRSAAAVEAGLEEIAVEVVDHAQAPIIIANTLMHRRHYNKSARAYLLAPFCDEVTAAAKRARALKVSANLRQNSRSTEPIGSSEEGSTSTMESFARQMGISVDLLRQGRDVFNRLEKVGTRPMVHAETKEKMTVRERVEQMLFEDGLGFQPVLAMLGYLAAGNTPDGQKLKDKRAEYGRLAGEKFKLLTDNFANWERTDAVERQVVYEALPKYIPAWPLDVCQRLYTELSKRREEWAGK